MKNPTAPRASHRLEWFVWSALVLTVLGIAAAFIYTRTQDAGLQQRLNVVGEVPPFILTNQLGQPVSLTNFLGQVWVADVIFSRCPVSCERMTQRMRNLQQAVPERLPVRFVSITADPDFDTPEILKRYGDARGVDHSRWHFLTGKKRDVYALSVGGLKFAVVDNEQRTIPEDLFVHSTHFALVDKRGRIRGYFEGTEEAERKQLLQAVKKLARETN
jgi:protein SCO1